MVALALIILAASPAWMEPNSREVALFPFTAKLNAALSTRQFGFAARALFPLHERLAVTASGKVAYGTLDGDESRWIDDFNRFDLDTSYWQQLVVGSILGGLEARPLTGTLMERFPLSVVVGVAIGAVSTRLLIANPTSLFPAATYVDTGWRFSGQLGAGLRLQLSRWFTVRLEVHDQMFQKATWATNGCNAADLRALDDALRAGRWPPLRVSPSCQVSQFEGADPITGRKRSDDVPLAYEVVKDSEPGIQHVVELYAGAGFSF